MRSSWVNIQIQQPPNTCQSRDFYTISWRRSVAKVQEIISSTNFHQSAHREPSAQRIQAYTAHMPVCDMTGFMYQCRYSDQSSIFCYSYLKRCSFSRPAWNPSELHCDDYNACVQSRNMDCAHQKALRLHRKGLPIFSIDIVFLKFDFNFLFQSVTNLKHRSSDWFKGDLMRVHQSGCIRWPFACWCFHHVSIKQYTKNT